MCTRPHWRCSRQTEGEDTLNDRIGSLGQGRLDALEEANRELSRIVEELRRQASVPAAVPAPPTPSGGRLQILRRLLLWAEARGFSLKGRRVLETGLFDAAAYKALTGLTGMSDRKAAAHYATIGERRGIPPSSRFDPVLYASIYPELLKDEMGLLVHYARHGRAERRLAAFAADDHLRPGGRPVDPAKPNALVVCHEASRTGAPILGWNLVQALSASHNVTVVLLSKGELVETFAADACLMAGPFEPTVILPIPMQRMIEAIERRGALDFAIVNSTESHPILSALNQAFVPSVMLVHEFPANVYPAGTMAGAMQRSAQVVFDAEVQRHAALEEWPGITRRNQNVFHQGASEVPRTPGSPVSLPEEAARKRETLYRRVKGAQGQPVVLGLGTVSMRKGVDLFIACAAAVAARLGPDRVRFIWIGHVPERHPDGNYPDWITDQVKRSGLARSYERLDPVDDLDGAFAAADIVLSPSRLDPFPNVAMDAALAGLPLICFERANGFAEFLVEDDLTRALAVPYLDVAAAADRIVDLLADAPRRKAIGVALAEKARRDFPMARYVERLQPVIAAAQAIAAQERRDVALLRDDPTFRADLWRDPFETGTREQAILAHVRKAASGQEANQYCRRPALGFVPQTYAEHHPALEALPFENPLAHWIRAGKPPGPWMHGVTVMEATTAKPAHTSLRTALHLHLHYPDLSDGMLAGLAVNASACDLLISTTSDDKARDLVRRFAGYGRGTLDVRVVPNRGRDVGPMLTLFADTLQTYDVVGHLHGKRSLALTSVGLSTDLGVQWHEFLLQHLLGAKVPAMDIILARFAADPALGLVFPEDPNLTGWSLDRDIALGLAARMDPAMVVPRFIDFPIGTMFWARPSALKPLFDLKLHWDDYPEEPVPIDGTMLHALERLLPVVCRHAGFTCETTHVPGVSR